MEKTTLKFFQQLINVSGVGPKYALAILTQMKPESAAAAIASGDYKALTKVSGIGPKTAQRIILDLKDKVGAVQAVPEELTQPAGQAVQGTAAEAAAALESLGYTRRGTGGDCQSLPGRHGFRTDPERSAETARDIVRGIEHGDRETGADYRRDGS